MTISIHHIHEKNSLRVAKVILPKNSTYDLIFDYDYLNTSGTNFRFVTKGKYHIEHNQEILFYRVPGDSDDTIPYEKLSVNVEKYVIKSDEYSEVLCISRNDSAKVERESINIPANTVCTFPNDICFIALLSGSILLDGVTIDYPCLIGNNQENEVNFLKDSNVCIIKN